MTILAFISTHHKYQYFSGKAIIRIILIFSFPQYYQVLSVHYFSKVKVRVCQEKYSRYLSKNTHTGYRLILMCR